MKKQLKKLIKKILIEKMYLLYFTQKFIRITIKNNRAINNKLKPAFNSVKKEIEIKKNQNDTVFILGSGSSINNLTSRQWKDIKKSDSIGFNYWPIHSFIPNYFIFELPRRNERKDIFIEILNARKDQYKDVKIIIKDYANQTKEDINKLGEIIDEVYALNDINLLPSKESLLLKTIIYTNLFFSVFNNENKISKVPKFRSSLSYIIYLSYLLGYKNIVLTGVDLNNTKYFYEDPSYKKSPFRIPKSFQTKAIHKTNDPEIGEVTISKVIVALNNEILKPANVNLFIGSKDSELYPTLPYYWKNLKV